MSFDTEQTYVISRTGRRKLLDPSKITNRLQQLRDRHPKIPHVNPYNLMLVITRSLSSDITTHQIDEYAANTAASLSLVNPYYMKLAARIAIDNHQKSTLRSFIDKMKLVYYRKVNNMIIPLLSKEFMNFVIKHQDFIESIIDYSRDFKLDFFGFRTFQKLYSLKIDGEPIERPQDMFMRAAIAIHMDDIPEDQMAEMNNIVYERIADTYNYLSCLQYTNASPMYFNAGSNHTQFSSCFLLGSHDSCEGIMKTATDTSLISKFGGGIGVHVHNWRGTGAVIRGTNGISSGIVPFLRIYNNVMRAFNQGGRRMGSAAIYLMPHHPDIMEFLKLKLPGGEEINRAHDLFYAVWLPDLFMERVKDDAIWSLFDPDTTVDLSDFHNDEYRNKYLQLEEEKKYVKQIRAREIWEAIYISNEQRGVPYICFSDTVNRLSNQCNLGTIKSSNLCAEIVEYSDYNEYAVCNLCSISLEACVKDETNTNHEFPIKPWFDFEHLKNVVKTATTNLNNIIDRNYYPTEETKRSNMRHRPIGIGIQGLANAFMKMRIPFESEPAKQLNKYIMETIYYAALSQSTRLAKLNGKSYPSMLDGDGAPISKGIFHWELAGLKEEDLSGMWDWKTLRAHIQKFGVYNSLLVALMPTSSTSQLLGNNECFEPFTSNVYKRKTLAGEYIVINKYLIHDLYKLGMWNDEVSKYLLKYEGSVAGIKGMPKELKQLYKTAWEIDQAVLIDYAADRQPFVDQAQSLNLYVEDLDIGTFNKLMFRAWRKGLKTGKYYLHTRPAIMPQKFTIKPATDVDNIENVIIVDPDTVHITTKLHQSCDLCSG